MFISLSSVFCLVTNVFTATAFSFKFPLTVLMNLIRVQGHYIVYLNIRALEKKLALRKIM